MTMNRDTDLLMNKWHKTPNAVIDSIVGTHITASAGWIVMTVIRHTDGFGRDSTAIPTSVFMQVINEFDNGASFTIPESHRIEQKHIPADHNVADDHLAKIKAMLAGVGA